MDERSKCVMCFDEFLQSEMFSVIIPSGYSRWVCRDCHKKWGREEFIRAYVERWEKLSLKDLQNKFW